MIDETRVKEVTIGKSTITVKVEKPQGEDSEFVDEDTLACPNRPNDEFAQAFAGLIEPFCEIYQVAAKWGQDATVTSLKIKHHKDDEQTAIIGVIRQFAKTGTEKKGIKTPAFVFVGEDLQCKSASAGLIADAVAQAMRYYSGDRRDMFLSGKEPTTKGKDDPDQTTIPGT